MTNEADAISKCHNSRTDPGETKCEFFAFEDVEAALKRIETIPVETGARVRGLVSVERFILPDSYVYPTGV